MWGEGNYLLRPGWDFCAKTQFLCVVSHFCASVSFRQLPSASAVLFLVGFAPRGIIHVEEGNYLLRPGWYFCAKTQFLGVVSHFCASVSFRQLPSASVALFLVGFAPRGIIHVEEGNYLLRPGWAFCAKTQFLGVLSHFCASVSFRQLP